MTIVGQICLLAAFAGSGYAAFACIAGALTDRRSLRIGGQWAGVASVVALSLSVLVLTRALYFKDFGFSYVAQYSSKQLPWQYSVSALWVGQAGSLLLWAWMLGALSVLFLRSASRRDLGGGLEDSDSTNGGRLSVHAFGLLMAYLCFLTGTMIFAADPMEPNIARLDDGQGLSPLLQHPAMLIHPPVVFLGYAGWAIPAALTIAALAGGGLDRRWLQQIRPWAMFSWAVLGSGILLGAQWSYEELGWGGYWAWDPVENASLLPWLTGTAFLHTLMAWRSRGIFKKTVAALAVATFGLCNFATFLTRSGIFSSLHAFSKSPIGWLFLALMLVLSVTTGVLILIRRKPLHPDRSVASLLSCEAMVLLSTVALVLLAAIVMVGTLFVALSEAIAGRRIMVGPEFYNYGLVSTGLVLLGAMAPAPLLQWGHAPSRSRMTALAVSAIIASLGAVIGGIFGFRQPLVLSLTWLGVFAITALVGRVVVDVERRGSEKLWSNVSRTLLGGRKPYSGFLAHLGFLSIAVGVTGSSLGTLRRDFELSEGESVRWADRSIQFASLKRTNNPDKVVVEAELIVRPDGGSPYTLKPAQHRHKLQEVWTTEAAIHPLWSGDFYTILHNGEGSTARFTFVLNPLMRWIWLGGWIIGISVVSGLWPERRARLDRKTSPSELTRQASLRGPSRSRVGNKAARPIATDVRN